MTDLLPCPNCKGKLKFNESTFEQYQTSTYDCSCGLKINKDQYHYYEIGYTRHHPEQLVPLVEALKMMLDRTNNPITDHAFYTLDEARLKAKQTLAMIYDMKGEKCKFPPSPANGLVPLNIDTLLEFSREYWKDKPLITEGCHKGGENDFSKFINLLCSKFGHKEVVLPSVEEIENIEIKCPLCIEGYQINPTWESFYKKQERAHKEGDITFCLEYFGVLSQKDLPWEERECPECRGSGYKYKIGNELAQAILSYLQKINGVKE